MSPINYDFTFKKLEELAQAWAGQFEKKPELELMFSTKEGLLTVNGICLNCPLSEINAQNARFDAEFIWIPTVSGDEYEISLDMPYEGPAKIGCIKHISTIYSAESK